jgi:ADP-heptose:LPS heptosyltransferase
MRSSGKMEEGKGKILILKLDAIGDYILLRNFFQELKRDPQWGSYHVTLVGNELWAELAKTYDKEFIDEWITVRPEEFRRSFFYRFKFLWRLQEEAYEILLAPTLSRKFSTDESMALAIRAKRKITQKSDCLNMKRPLRWLGALAYHEIYDLKPKETLFEFIRNRNFFEQFCDKKMTDLIFLVYTR